MTRVLVDDRMSEFSLDSGNRLEDLVQELTSKLPPNRVIKEILLDGRYLPKSLRNRDLGELLSEMKELQIRTADRQAWAANGLEQAAYSIDRLQRSLLKAAEMCFDRNPEPAHRFIGQCLEGLEQFLENILVTREVRGWNFDQIRVEGVPLSRMQGQLGKSLEGLAKALLAQSMEAAADIIEYEILPGLSSWGQALRQLRLSSFSNA